MKYAIILICLLLPITINAAEWGGSHAAKAPPEWLVHDNNNYWLAVHSRMGEGHNDDGYPSGEYPGGFGNEYLFWSYAIVGVRSGLDIWVIDGPTNGTEFHVEEVDTFYSTDGEWPGGFTRYGDYDTSTLCNDSSAGEIGPIPILARRQTWSFTGSSLDDCIGIKYVIRNDSDDTFDEVYVAHYADYDIAADGYEDDLVDYDQGREMVYMYDSGSEPVYVGITSGSGDWIGRGMASWTLPEDPNFDYELFVLLQGYGWNNETVPDDYRVCLILEFDPLDFEPGETIVAGFYQVAGMSLAELRANADAARASYVEDDPPLGIENIKSASLGEIKAMFR